MTGRRVLAALVSLSMSTVAAAGVLVPVHAAAAPAAVEQATVDGLIVTYASGVSAATADRVLDQALAASGDAGTTDLEQSEQLGFGLSAVDASEPMTVTDATELAAALEASPLVVSAELDIPVSTFDVQVDPPWNLDRIDQRSSSIDRRYRYEHTGAGVRVYVVDSGVRGDHQQFGGRVVPGFSRTVFGGDGRTDPHGHGTHVAGIVAGSTWGVAKEATIVPVQVLGSTGSGTASDVIAGLQWIVAAHPAGTPGVVNLSFGADLDGFPAGAGESIDSAVRAVVAAGLTVVVAAGNGDRVTGLPKDACGFTPARVSEAITVAASRLSSGLDRPASFSNFGTCTDIFAPGVAITSAGRASATANAESSGTSMAAPHVAGAVAQLLEQRPTLTPAEVWSAIAGAATAVDVSDRLGDPDLLVHTEGQGSPLAPTAVTAGPGDGTLTVNWSPPVDDGGAPIDGYTARVFADPTGGVAVTTCSTDGTGLSCLVEGLVNDVTYHVDVVATSALGSSTPSAPRVAARPGIPIVGTPTISGLARFGSTLIAVPGSWGPAPVTFGYSWLRDGVAIDGAAGPSHTLGVDDVGRRISVVVTATAPGYGSLARTSAPTAQVAGSTFRITPMPVVSGSARFGSTLTVRTGTWAPFPATTTVVWKRNGVPIVDATSTAYTLGVDDIGARISVAVTGSRPGYTPVSRTSPQTPFVAALAFAAAPAPRVVGVGLVGSSLSVDTGVWAPTPTSFTYTWMRNGRPISGASGVTYVVTPADRGTRLTVRVTAARPGYATTTRTSRSTGTVRVATRVARDGLWLVGTQLATDTYITATATSSCTWVRRSGAGTPPGAPIADDRGSGQRIVTVSPDDAVLQTSGCGRWYRLADMAAAPRSVIPGGGVYSVAHHLVPGTYRASTRGGTSCYWARLSGFGGSVDDIIAQAVTRSARPVVVIDGSTTGFEASRACGSWTRIG